MWHLVFAEERRYKGIIHFKCRDCGGRSHDDVFDEYSRIYPEQQMGMVIGFVVDEKNNFEFKSGTFNARKQFRFEGPKNSSPPMQRLAEEFKAHWGEANFSVSERLAEEIHCQLFDLWADWGPGGSRAHIG